MRRLRQMRSYILHVAASYIWASGLHGQSRRHRYDDDLPFDCMEGLGLACLTSSLSFVANNGDIVIRAHRRHVSEGGSNACVFLPSEQQKESWPSPRVTELTELPIPIAIGIDDHCHRMVRRQTRCSSSSLPADESDHVTPRYT
eukprot:scaffold7456_cov126-Skeletonema_dohrnii-CCMP3373.AAC.4